MPPPDSSSLKRGNPSGRRLRRWAAVAAGGVLWCSTLIPGKAAVFTAGDVFVYRVGDGSATLSGAATPVFIDEYDAAGLLVRSIAMPAAASGANHILTASGTATSEGLLTLSADGSTITLAGYDAAVGTASITTSASASVNRVVAFIDPAGTIDTTTALTDFASASNPRGVVSSNGLDLWVTGGTGGVRYAHRGDTTSTQLSTAPTNVREVAIFGGQLYVSSGATGFRLASVGTGLPTMSGQTVVNLPGVPTTSGSPYQFAMFDLNPGVTGVDTIYVADDTSVTGGLVKYSFDGTSWVLNGNLAVPGNSLRGLSAYDTGSGIQLFLSNPTTLFSFTDTSGYNGTLSGSFTSLVSAATNTAFRGAVVIPVPEPAGIGVAIVAVTLLLLVARPRGVPCVAC